MSSMTEWNKLLGNNLGLSVLGRRGIEVKEEHKKLDARKAKARRVYREPTPRPAPVQAAVLAQDSEACARFGRAGGKAKRKKKGSKVDQIFQKDLRELKASQVVDRYFGSLTKMREANEHICPID